METQAIINIEKSGIMIHRFICALYIFFRYLFQFEADGVLPYANTLILIFLIISEIIEEVGYYNNYFGSIVLIRGMRYVQCLFVGLLFAFLNNSLNLQVILISLFIFYMTEIFITLDLTSRIEVVFCYASVFGPIGIASFININRFVDVAIFFSIVYFMAEILISYVIQMRKTYWAQVTEINKLEKLNNNISNMQKVLKDSNVNLTLQKVELQKANEQVKTANAEMRAQTQILNYIATSNEVPKISMQIIDSIMELKKLSFCAVYIKENVYMNKEANFMIRTDIAQLQGKIKDNIEDIYFKMVDEFRDKAIYGHELKKHFPFLKNININSMYIHVLGNDEPYGLFMIGDQRRNLFENNLSFYDVIIAQYDIAISNAKIYNEMQYMARKDSLTGINNRLYFRKLFYKELDQIIKSNSSICVALLDIDKFKNVNDTYGHLAGDEVIKRVANLLERHIEGYSGFICRYGGEEFVAVLPNYKLEVGQSIIEELFEDILNQIVCYNDLQISISVSIGLTAYPEVCSDSSQLLRRADHAMYYAKEHGRAQICIDNGLI